MQIENLIKSLEEKITQIETAITQSVTNHQGLLGMLQGTKEALILAQEQQKAAEDTSVAGGEIHLIEYHEC